MLRLSNVILAVLLAATVAGAEELRVLVMDRDLELPLEGVILSLSGESDVRETDALGRAIFALPDGFTRGTLLAQIPGYENQKRVVTSGDGEVVLELSISGIIEGAELVVERAAPGTTDAKPGISVAMEAEEMKTTAFIGMVEDIMSSVTTLPGVGYTGGWGAQPSVRGGYPSEMGTVLDGVYVTQPYHWGGAFSIFNPHMVESFKMSHGIFSTRYGRAMSGLLEVTTKEIDKAQVRVEGGMASTSTDLFVELPVNDKAGLYFGGKVTYMETLKVLNWALHLNDDLDEMIPVMPYIRDLYVKGYYTPTPLLDISINAFLGTDGIGVYAEVEDEGIKTEAQFDWMNILGFFTGAIRWMPSESTVLRLRAGYNNNTYDMVANFIQKGGRPYSQEFKDTFGAFLGGAESYNLDGLDQSIISTLTLHQGQMKLELDKDLASLGVLGLGAEGIFQYSENKQKIDGWQEKLSPDGSYRSYESFTYELDTEGNRMVNSAVFALWEFGNEASLIRGEGGLRGEHFYLWNDTFDLQTYPVLDPRLSASWVPLKNKGVLDTLTLSAGSGIFSMLPLDAIAADRDMGLEDFEVGPNRAWFQVLGLNLQFQENVNFQLEGYYKHYFNRMYVVPELNDQNAMTLEVKTDGIGYAAGFDFMLQKKNSRRLDGYLSYSFVMAQFKNPSTPTENYDTDTSGMPLDKWFYPSFHRFHHLNLVLNWKPADGWTITGKITFASGTPKRKVGDIYAYPAVKPDGTVIERYRRTEEYDDELRNDFSCPVDLRIGYQSYKPGSKVRREFYIGAEDIFVNLYEPKGNSSFDSFTGKEIEGGGQADFNIGMPMISFGYKISY